MTALTLTGPAIRRAAGRLSGPQRGGVDPLRRPAPAGGWGGDLLRKGVEKNDRPAAA